MILESYGSTECCGSGSATSFANYQLEDGCVGPPQPWNEIKLESVEDMGYHSRDGVGEVCIRGDNIMIGTYSIIYENICNIYDILTVRELITDSILRIL